VADEHDRVVLCVDDQPRRSGIALKRQGRIRQLFAFKDARGITKGASNGTNGENLATSADATSG